MSSFTRSRWCRSIALLLALALIQTAPGLAAYSALAANLKVAPVAGGNVVAPLRVGAPLGSAVLLAPHNGLLPASLTPSLNMAPVAPVLSAAANTPAVSPVIAAPLTVAPVQGRLPVAAHDVPDRAVGRGSAASTLRNEAAATTIGALQETLASIETPKPSAEARAAAIGAAMTVFGRRFDGRRAHPGDVPPAAMANDAPSFTPLAAPADAPNASADVPPAPSAPQNAAPGRARVSIGLALAIAGGVGAWYAAPFLVPLLLSALGSIPFVTVPMLPLLAYQSIVTALGVGAGLAAFSTSTWKNFPRDLYNDAVGAARTTFRFWARFGMIFDSVLRGKSTDDATKGAVSGNILTYPLIAMVFVAVGYVFVPVAFVLGAAWRVVGTPLLAAFRGAKEVAIGFFPWLARVFRFLGRVVRNIVPFVGGFLWGAVRGLFIGGAAGVYVLSGPIVRDAVDATYEPKTVPGWIGYRLLQAVGLLASGVVGLAGFVVGLVFSPLHALLSGLERAFDWSDASESANAFFKRWVEAVINDKAFSLLPERSFPTPSAETLNTRRVRLVNNVLIAAAMLPSLPFLALATLIRSLRAAFTGEKIAGSGDDINTGMTDPGKDITTGMAEPGAERPTETRAGFIAPVIGGLLGAAGGVYVYALLASVVMMPAGLLALAPWAAATIAGAGLGMALSQPQALLAIPGRAVADAKDGGSLAWGGWTGAGERVVNAVLGTDKAAPLGYIMAAIPGAIMTTVSGLTGIVYGVASGVTKASWSGFMETVRRFIPALRRFLEWSLRVLKNIVPFVFGFLWGALVGLFKTSLTTAVSFFKPVIEAVEAEGSKSRPSEAQIGAGLLMGLTLLPLALAVFIGGLALGATLGLPVILTFALSRAVKWAKPSDKSVAYWRAWEHAIDRAAQDALNAVSGVFAGVGPEMPVWRLYVRVASALLGAPVIALVVVAAAAKAYIRSFAYARIIADGGQLPPVSEPTAPAAERPEAPAASPVGKPPVALAAVAGALGLAAGVASAFYLGLPFLAGLAGWTLWAGYASVFAGLPLLGLATGLALTQPVFWKNVFPLAMEHGKAGMSRSYEYWKNSADSALKSLFNVERGSIFNLPSRVMGGVLGAFWAVGGLVYGAGAAFLIGAYTGAKQVVYEMLPALRVAFETAMKVLRRVVPFVFGLFGGFVAGVVGSAAFGALLLGRPYFKHVVAEDFERRGALGTLGNLFLKLIAGVLGVLFGAGGAVIGVMVAIPYSLVAAAGLYFGMSFGPIGVVVGVLAAPYALTTAAALAFRFAEIGGPVQRFFDHWSYGSLREELRRINQLTSKFKFEDAPPGREPSLAAGWIRMANIFPATLAAIFAAGIAGFVSYFRSLGAAYKSSTSGQPIPRPAMDEESRRDWDRTWSRAGKTARSFFFLGVLGAAVGGALWAFSAWTPLGLAGWLLVGATAGLGVVLALSLAGVIAIIALIYWIGGQLR